MNFPGRTALFAALLAVACGPEPEAAAELGLRLQTLSEGLPSDLKTLRVTYTLEGQSPVSRDADVTTLTRSGGKHRLSLPSLPPETPVRVRVEGLNGAAVLAYVGVLGPVSLGRGETLQQSIVLAPAHRSIPIEAGSPPARFLHTATRLEDGRVLIAGGFGEPVSAPCPPSSAKDALCFALTALHDVWVFDPNQLAFHAIEGGLLEPRAGHSATPLPDGRVLLAGGASAALLVLEPEPRAGSFRFIPVDGQGNATASASFELFEPLPEDTASVRDPGRGRILGSAGQPGHTGPLSAPRFLHAAAANPLLGDQVILAGGVGAERSSHSYEVFDARRTGGYGVVPSSLTPLNDDRTTPSAVALQAGQAGWVWLFGGNHPRSDTELAERWSASEADAVGAIAHATESGFPKTSDSDASAHPQYAFPRTLSIPLTGGTHALGAAGAASICDSQGQPAFSPTSLALDAVSCTEAALRQCFVVEAATGTTTPCTLSAAHLSGAIAALDDGRAAVTGGFADLSWLSSPHIELVALDAKTAAPSFDTSFTLHQVRAMHTSTALFDGGILSFGGLVWEAGQLRLVKANAELLWL